MITVWTVGGAVGALPPQGEVLPGSFFVVHLATMVLTYTLFGAASLAAAEHSRTLGALLFVPPVLFVGMVAAAAIVGNSASDAFVVGSGLALAHLAIGSVRVGGTSRSDARVRDVATG